MTVSLHAPSGPVAPAERALGPDLARGFMLLFIALANSHYFLSAPVVLGGYPQDGSALDSAVTWLIATFVDGRAFPMFGLLFGYGVAQIVRRQAERKPSAVRLLLWRRAAVLVVVGLLDALLFFVGDILAMYGVLLFVGAWLVRVRDRWLLTIALGFMVLVSMPSPDSMSISPNGPDASMLPPDVITMIVERVPMALFVAGLGPFGFMCPFLIGLWAGRRRILEQPERHRTLLRVTAVAGIGIAVLGAQPVSLMLAGVVAPPDQSTLDLLGPLHDSSGVLGGFGYAAVLALIAARLGARRGPVVDAIAATGQRSMTCYLMQSPVWALIFTPFLLDLSGPLGVTSMALLATATWVLTVVAADQMRRAGRRGPFEQLVRRVTYGRTGPSGRRLPA
ncbi:DUF418 domain-containing protein [Phytohabitans flavus]|uniref:DUF418 domain-containing protein n=1 Tax=Phytohabitans flavus TaxID=1076124 RepID=A0A6F8XVH5_9ACTN|nr:DUF418 domain-containing protein [Phytohabitans flavus]BCB77862.1 hypothetical protein Pflav_042720 [Phytohabitans flavus]